VVNESVDEGIARRLPHPENRGHRLRHEIGVGERGELDQPHPVLDVLRRLRGDREGEARLARAPGTGEGQKPALREQSLDLCRLALAPDEAGQLQRQVVRPALGRSGGTSPGASVGPFSSGIVALSEWPEIPADASDATDKPVRMHAEHRSLPVAGLPFGPTIIATRP
jgi:hypothetical protein